jgi:hypothetical protein
VVEFLKAKLNAKATAKQLGINHKTVLAVAKNGADRYSSDDAIEVVLSDLAFEVEQERFQRERKGTSAI